MPSTPLLYVLYGSQTGNAESIAKEFSELLTDKEVENKLMNLNSFKSVAGPGPDEEHVLVICCSTTGNGDCPENGDAWWRSIKLRSAAKDKFARCKYLVLGLGDSNYDKFCFMGKSIDKRMSELGGERVQPLTCVDETTGLEEAVEKWKASTLSFLVEMFKTKEEVQTPLPETKSGQEDKNDEEEEDVKSMREQFTRKLSVKQSPATDVLDSLLTTMPEHIHPLSYFIGLNSLDARIMNMDMEELAGKESRRTGNGEAKIVDNIVPEGGELEAKGVGEEYSASSPYLAKVHTARWLTNPATSQSSLYEGLSDAQSWGQSKRVVLCEVNVSDMRLSYQPGDSVGICTPNPPYAVNILIRRLLQAHGGEITAETRVLLPQQSVPQSLSSLLTYSFDLTGMPKKSTIKSLARYCTDEQEKRQMLSLVHKDMKTLWQQFVEQQGLGIAEVFYLFKSCLPSLSQLFALLSPAVPRYYSISSSTLSSTTKLSFAFSTVRYSCTVANSPPRSAAESNEYTIKRAGVATLYLESILRNYLYSSSAAKEEEVKLKIFYKPSLCFHLPGNLSTPLILVGPGTGVAPFMSFLSHRLSQSKERRQHCGDMCGAGFWRGGFELEEMDLPREGGTVDQYMQSVPIGDIALFFGCRNEDDFLFKADLHNYVKEGVLTKLFVAMSRESEQKVYVTHKILDQAPYLAELIVQRHGVVYICGDGNKMAKDVVAALKEVLVLEGKMDKEAAESYVCDMQHRKRLLLDIWSP